MSSDAILDMINAKKDELVKLEQFLTTASKAEEGLSCYAEAFGKAASAMEGAGSIGGKPIDQGKAKERAGQFSNLQASVEGLSNDVKAQIAILTASIEVLYNEYYAALEVEARRIVR